MAYILGTKYKKLFLLIFLFVSLGLALEKVFSLNLSLPSDGRSVLAANQAFLLTNDDGLLSARDSLKILRDLKAFVVTSYSVGRNDWIEKLARELGIPAIAIRSTNDLEDPRLRPRQQIIIQNKKGMAHIVKEGETVEGVVRLYEKLGAKRENILAANALDEITYLKDGELHFIEGSKLWIPDARRSYPFLTRPVHWLRISSRFGVRWHPLLHAKRRHDGYDMVAPYGAPVYAGQDGVVTNAGWMGGYGNMIEIRHSKITTRYGHLSKINVQVGQRVHRRQMIGRVGSTGLSTGPHLHFEVRLNSTGRAIPPGKYLY